jgi:hypothetical protein
MKIDDDTKLFFIRRIKWIVLYLGISLILVLILPAPYDLVSVFGLYILVNLLRFRGIIKGYRGIIKGYRRTGGVKDLLGLLFPPASGTIQNESQLKYYCMNCGKEHREIKCTNCGSKMKRIG